MEHKCNNCKVLQKKVELYEKFFKEMKALEAEEKNNDMNNNPLGESIVIKKDKNGDKNMKINSNLSESFLVINGGKNLKELNQKDQAIINEQKNLHDYTSAKKYVEKANGVYSVIRYIVGIGKWFIL